MTKKEKEKVIKAVKERTLDYWDVQSIFTSEEIEIGKLLGDIAKSVGDETANKLAKILTVMTSNNITVLKNFDQLPSPRHLVAMVPTIKDDMGHHYTLEEACISVINGFNGMLRSDGTKGLIMTNTKAYLRKPTPDEIDNFFSILPESGWKIIEEYTVVI